MEKAVRTSRIYNVISALLAFLVWGGWAYFVNSAKSTQHGVVSGIAQGTGSFLMTFFMVYLVTLLFHRFQNPVYQLILPGALTVAFTTTCLVGVHYLVGTPRIFDTVSPAFVVGSGFCIYTCCQLQNLHKNQGVSHE